MHRVQVTYINPALVWRWTRVLVFVHIHTKEQHVNSIKLLEQLQIIYRDYLRVGTPRRALITL